MKAFRQRSFLVIVVALYACNPEAPSEDTAVAVQTPVTITSIKKESLTEYVELNATSAFLQKNYIKAPSNGYVEAVHVLPGQRVIKGETLFTVITKEAKVIGNSINKLDSSFKFSGVSRIRANASGFVSVLNHQQGDYVQEGEQLAVINDASSFVFVLNVPYELNQVVRKQPTVELTLPDGQRLKGFVSRAIPKVDSASQTQQMIIQVTPREQLPEDLIARVKILKAKHGNTVALPKAAVLSNETQNEFWVMKLVNDTTAVKIPVKKGIETREEVEILSPEFSPKDRFVLSGNYGLADTAKIKIVKR